MEKEKPSSIPYIAFEGEMARMERIIKRLVILAVVELLLLFGSNFAWIYYENQFEDVVTTIEADATDGGNAIINRDGEVNVNGTRESINP